MRLWCTVCGIACLMAGSFAIAQENTSADTEIQVEDSYQPDDQVSDFDVKTAYDTMQTLQASVDGITQQLYDLDAKERDGEVISDQYRAVRNEIVNVIQTINTTTEEASAVLQKIAMYKKLIYVAYKDLQASREGFKETKEYLAAFANFIYKLDNKLYDTDTQSIDEIKLLINSDNIPRTLANDAMVESLLIQFNDLLTNFTSNEEKQLALIKKLNQMKIQAKEDIKEY